MQDWIHRPTFLLYAASGLVLCANLAFLWGYSGAVRGRSKTVVNAEDAATVARGAEVVAADPPAVARVLRAHANAQASFVPFGFLGLLYAFLDGPPTLAAVLFGVFVAGRLAHSVAYLRELQPWRTVSFAIAGLDLLALLLVDVWLTATR